MQPLAADTIRLRWLPVAADSARHMARWRGMLDAEELARADRFMFDPDREIFTAAHALARSVLSEATGRPTAFWRYAKGPSGKPRLAMEDAAGGLRFNISHTSGMVCCAVAHHDIGVDVEASDRRFDLAIADRFFAPEEVALLHATPPERQVALFFRFWTLKEAFIKTTGEGLSRPLASFSFAFDPPRVRFHPERDELRRNDDPALWRFMEFSAAENRPVALAVRTRCPDRIDVDAQEATAEAVVPR